ncbi:DUF7678 domain-containing protein [Paenibacillus polymyxa]|uniref:DUF7678 domain-containing protein n=1 Tax=Paenibacillus polymyxa TaxID=1406 RepID=UPI0025B6AE8C|nr:hypothetical protein [Paenibacillus polymyxa]MDN4090924.1 hypothetical protein [Paenibacillus polymyxa]
MEFIKQSGERQGSRYVTEYEGYYIAVQTTAAATEQGIGAGRIHRLLLYPAHTNQVRGKVLVYDQGWHDGIPQLQEQRELVERTVMHFDQVPLDWVQEERRLASYSWMA